MLDEHDRAPEPILREHANQLNARCDEVSPPPEHREDWGHDFVPDLGDGWMRNGRLGPIPPGGRSSSGRSTATRECSDTLWEKLPAPESGP